jgi:hypothetical protein
MPGLIVDFITSLDGYGAAEGWPGCRGLEGPEYLAWLGDQPEGATRLSCYEVRGRAAAPRALREDRCQAPGPLSFGP